MKIFIPIKHNSQRVPKKNYRVFNGEPLYKHTLLKYTTCDVYVDTDSEEIIKEISKDDRLKNVVPYMRHPDLRGDKVSVCDLIRDFIVRHDIDDVVAQIHVTSPFLNRSAVSVAASQIGPKYDSVVSCTKHNSRFWRNELYGPCPINHNPMKLEQTQDLPTLYEENSAFYIFKSIDFIKSHNRIGVKPFFYAVKHPENLDIDTESDWELVKALEEVYYK